uniref:Uncharacterized protein n=1 Tax=Romanomermis culicivorax TaxID=13658 RepID=A0A915K3K8_ROMCU
MARAYQKSSKLCHSWKITVHEMTGSQSSTASRPDPVQLSDPDLRKFEKCYPNIEIRADLRGSGHPSYLYY